METYTELTKSANTHTEMKPIDNKNWGETNKIEVVFSIDSNNEKRCFRGLLDLTAIIKH